MFIQSVPKLKITDNNVPQWKYLEAADLTHYT